MCLFDVYILTFLLLLYFFVLFFPLSVGDPFKFYFSAPLVNLT